MSWPPLRALLAVPVVAAAVLGGALVWLASVAAGTLGERDEAVRAGTLLRLGHDLEAELRDAGPDDSRATLAAFVARNATALAGAELLGPQGSIVREGDVGVGAMEQPLMLGPSWRQVIGLGGRGAGPGRGGAARLRLQPTLALGASDPLASVVLVGAMVAAVALVGFSILGVAGLAQRQRLAAAEAERQRLEVLALAGAGLAHRIRNPLAAIKGTSQLMLEGAAPQTDARARRILDASLRIEALLGRLLAFARPPEPNPESLNLAEISRRVAGRAPGVVRVFSPESVPGWADEEHAESIVEELVANARAFDPNGDIEVSVRPEGSVAVVEVSDRGPGLSVGAERAFEPYLTTRPEGTGLGLPIVRAFARANGGEVTLAPRPGGGCVARLVVPARRA